MSNQILNITWAAITYRYLAMLAYVIGSKEVLSKASIAKKAQILV